MTNQIIKAPLGITLSAFWEIGSTGMPTWAKQTLSYYDLKLNDIVTFTSTARGNGMTLYRIDKDSPPRLDATYGTYKTQIPLYRRNRKANNTNVKTQYTEYTEGWCYPGKSTRIPNIRLHGCIELKPVFQLLPGSRVKKHTVPYSSIRNSIKKIDILELARSFSDFQSFIQGEAKRLSGEAA